MKRAGALSLPAERQSVTSHSARSNLPSSLFGHRIVLEGEQGWAMSCFSPVRAGLNGAGRRCFICGDDRLSGIIARALPC